MTRPPRPPTKSRRSSPTRTTAPDAGVEIGRAPTTAEQLARLHDMMFEQAAVPLALIDTEHRFVRVNSIWAGHHGKSVADFPGRRYADLYPGDASFIERRTRLLDQVITSRQPLRLLGQPFEFADQPGRGRTWWDWTVSPLCDERGEVELLMFASIDATERVRTELALAEKSEHAQSLLRLSRRFESADTQQELVNAAFTEVKTILGYQRLWVYLFSEDRTYGDLLVVGGNAFDYDVSRLPITGDRMIEEIAHSRNIVLVEDAQTDPRVNREVVAQLGNRTTINVPIILHDRHFGAVGTGTFRDEGVRVPTATQQEYLMALASHLAVSLDRIHSLGELRHSEQALKASEQRFRSFFENNNAVMLLLDPGRGTIVDANPAAARYYGYPPETLRAMKTGDIGQFVPDADTTAQPAAAARDRLSFVAPQHLADGTQRIAEVHTTPVNVENAPLLFSIVHDITERRKAERQIALLSIAVDNVHEAAYLIDSTDGSFCYVNEEACRMLGYTRDELVRMRPQDIDPAYARAVASNSGHVELMSQVTNFETRHRTRDGRLIPVEINFNRFH